MRNEKLEMNLEEKFISRENIFDGVVLRVVRDTVELPNGKKATRELCLHNGAVAIIPVLDDGRIDGIGTHAELLESCSIYKEISDSQMGGAFLE